jgi:altronate hydrolase
MTSVLRIDTKDNVAVALVPLLPGDIIELVGAELLARDVIPKGHKIALNRIGKGENVIKYGFPIGHAERNILSGQLVHTHNMHTDLSGDPGQYEFSQKLEPVLPPEDIPLFKGYRRLDGSVGIRNELWIIPLVGCVNGVGEQIINRFRQKAETIRADAVHVLRHEYGCSQLGDDLNSTRKLLQDLVVHPNCGGALVLGLGCENNTPEEFKNGLPDYDTARVRFLTAQDVSDEVEEGARLLMALNENLKADVREDVPISELRVGLKCGGSDGFSGITANPLIGRFTDYITACGGTAVLTEVPEMFGAETLLMERAESRTVFDKTAALINDFKAYFTKSGQPVYENPSPGNKKGGITTLEEKALGCTQKAGHAAVTDVLDYGDTLSTKGLNLLCAPGNDLVSSTALAAAGCQLILFSTGRGTPFGTVVPTIKISTNTALAKAKPGWIDFDAGALVNNYEMDALVADLTALILDIANGKQACNEINQFSELAIWKNGVTL